MTQSSSSNPVAQLKKCLSLAQNIETHDEANQTFEQLHQSMVLENAQAAELMEMLWQEVIAARRSAQFWQQISDVEKAMADQMLESLTQSRQNYLRLMQEM